MKSSIIEQEFPEHCYFIKNMNLGLGVMSVVITAVVMFPTLGVMVAFITGDADADADICETKLPIPTQKAMTSPDASPTRAP